MSDNTLVELMARKGLANGRSSQNGIYRLDPGLTTSFEELTWRVVSEGENTQDVVRVTKRTLVWGSKFLTSRSFPQRPEPRIMAEHVAFGVQDQYDQSVG